jgi:hypothetical protein
MNGAMFANRVVDGDVWGPILEKAWAKMNGNYEMINNGW